VKIEFLGISAVGTMVSFKKTVTKEELNKVAEELVDKTIRICQDIVLEAREKLKIQGNLITNSTDMIQIQ